MGVGLIMVVDPANVASVLFKTDGYVIGEVLAGDKGVELV
jgi:phosphoribosylformylglycinamidine cyclo-ligase